MNYLAKNISVRGCEKLGIIGNGISSAIVDKSGMIEWASFEKLIYLIILFKMALA